MVPTFFRLEQGNDRGVEWRACPAMSTRYLRTNLELGLARSRGFFCENETSRETNLGVVLDTPSEGPDRLFVPIVTVIVPIVTQYT